MLELSQAEGYPYCGRGRETLTDPGRSYVVLNSRTADGDRRNAGTYAVLVDRGGQGQIMFPVDHRTGDRVYEREDIVAHLGTHYD